MLSPEAVETFPVPGGAALIPLRRQYDFTVFTDIFSSPAIAL
jgi:hypothetical protein